MKLNTTIKELVVAGFSMFVASTLSSYILTALNVNVPLAPYVIAGYIFTRVTDFLS